MSRTVETRKLKKGLPDWAVLPKAWAPKPAGAPSSKRPMGLGTNPGRLPIVGMWLEVKAIVVSRLPRGL